jgi:predicted membrane metal-binding protein
MRSYNINKGIGRSVEFKGLKAQYLYLFVGGLLTILILVMLLYMFGVNSYACLIIGGAGGLLIVWQTFALNRKYGMYGLMKVGAKRRHPHYITCRKAVYRLFQFTSEPAKR